MSVYGAFALQVLDDQLSGATVKALLVTPDYIQDHTQEFRADIVEEVTGTGYTAGGVTVSGVALSLNTDTGRVAVTCDPVDFGSIDVGDTGGIVFYVSTGSSATDRLISCDFWGAQYISDALPFTYAPDTDDGFVIGIT